MFTYGVSFATQTLNTLGLAIRGVQSVAFRNLTIKSNEKIKGNE